MFRQIKRLQGFGGLGVSLGAVLTLVLAAPGSVFVALILLHPLEMANEAIKGRLDVTGAVILSLMALGLLCTAMVYVWLLRFARTVTKIIATPAIAFGCAAVLVGTFIWIAMGFRESELRPRLPMAAAQTVLGFSLLWSGRVLLALLASLRTAPGMALRGIVLGLIGSAGGAALGAAIAVARGLEPSPFEPPHWFYVLAVPAMAAFGWAAPRPQAASASFAVVAVIFTAATTLYVPLTVLAALPEVACDWGVWNPHYEILGFEWEPWRWKQKHNWNWIIAPGALTELSLLHIFDPVPKLTSPKGGYCPD